MCRTVVRVEMFVYAIFLGCSVFSIVTLLQYFNSFLLDLFITLINMQ